MNFFHLWLSDSGEYGVPVSRQSLLHGVEDVVDALGGVVGLALLLAGRPDLLKIGNDPVAPEEKEIKTFFAHYPLCENSVFKF